MTTATVNDLVAADITRLGTELAEATFEAEGLAVTVTYVAEPARGDDGRLVPGHTTGEFTVQWADRAEPKVVHHGPMPEARPYIVRTIADEIATRFSRAKFDRLYPGR